MKKIVVLDGYAANPGDISWEPIRSLGELTVYDNTSPGDVAERIKDADYVFTNKVPITAASMDSALNLKWIGVLATGYNIVDVSHAGKIGIPVANIPSYSTDTVAQNVFAHILNICNRIRDHSLSISAGKWSRCEHFAFWDYPQIELSGKTMGIIGFGAIGSKTAEIAQAFGMKLLINTPHPKKELETDRLLFCDTDTLFRNADFISLHCPLTDSTKEIINKKTLSIMKKTAVLINTGRGPLINETELADALMSNTIAAAGLDVLCKEPPEADNPLFKCDNCFISPHISWASSDARIRLFNIAYDNLNSFINGSPINLV